MSSLSQLHQPMQLGENRSLCKQDKQRFSPSPLENQQEKEKEKYNNNNTPTQYEREESADDPSICTSKMPLWYHTLFPMVPQPFKTVEDDEDDTIPRVSEFDQEESLSLSLFPTHESILAFIDTQVTRTNLLKHIKELISGGTGKKSVKAKKKYEEMHLDVKLLIALSDLFSFTSSTCELVHHCTSRELTRLQSQNVLVMNEILGVLQVMMKKEELQLTIGGQTAPTTTKPDPLPVNIADRLADHNSAEIFLTMFESLVDELSVPVVTNETHLSDSDNGGDSVLPPRMMKLTLIESILRCIHTQLEVCSTEQRLNIIKQLYLFIPSQLQTPLLSSTSSQQPSAGEGSDSEVIRLLISLVREKYSVAITVYSVRILTHIAKTPIIVPLDAPPVPVAVYPMHSNSTLTIASKLFVFPRDPALWLVNQGDLLNVYLETLHPFLQESVIVPASQAVSKTVTPLLASRSLLIRQESKNTTTATMSMSEVDEDGSSPPSSSFFLSPTPFSPPSVHPPRCHQSLPPHDHPLTELDRDEFHHASFGALSERRFMLDQYMKVSNETPNVGMQNEANAGVMEYPTTATVTQPPLSIPELPPSVAATHFRSAPVWQSNEVLTAVLSGLASLCHHNTMVSLHVLSQVGLVSFATSLLSHKIVQLSLLAMKLLGTMSNALIVDESEPLPLSLFLTSLPTKPRSLSRRHSSELSGGRHAHRRASIGAHTSSPLLTPHSSSFSPKLASSSLIGLHSHAHSISAIMGSPSFSIGGGCNNATTVNVTLTRNDARRLLDPLVKHSIQILLDQMKHYLPIVRSKVKVIDQTISQQIIDTLSLLVTQDENQLEVVPLAVPTLVALLFDPLQSTPIYESCINCLTELTASESSAASSNRTLVIESKVLSSGILSLLNSLRPFHERRLADSNARIHPSVASLQLACIQLCKNLNPDFKSYASGKLADCNSAIPSIIDHLKSLIESDAFKPISAPSPASPTSPLVITHPRRAVIVTPVSAPRSLATSHRGGRASRGGIVGGGRGSPHVVYEYELEQSECPDEIEEVVIEQVSDIREMNSGDDSSDADSPRTVPYSAVDGDVSDAPHIEQPMSIGELFRYFLSERLDVREISALMNRALEDQHRAVPREQRNRQSRYRRQQQVDQE